ncbi:hypothetical protein LTR56_006232 [Elasticomyces elasticus]|nr:hypothetical protein LTR56_006232 [Elasticomyces elasticus]KAK3666559.1 hypothetical protein LTR22_002503 [Elasticomyces elasticus]KAK4928308.1 hypothetical protein LTR49_004985 [Elasticomyces elasticus]KAK5763871.1 hypothetical protein LTS12_005989 [Elasticomyces elasticus]
MSLPVGFPRGRYGGNDPYGYGGYGGYGGSGPVGGFGYGGWDPWLYSPYPWSPFANQYPGYDDGYDDDYDRGPDYFTKGVYTGLQLSGMMGQMGGGGGWGGGSGWGGGGRGGRGSRGYGGGYENCNVALGVPLEGAEGVAAERP